MRLSNLQIKYYGQSIYSFFGRQSISLSMSNKMNKSLNLVSKVKSWENALKLNMQEMLKYNLKNVESLVNMKDLVTCLMKHLQCQCELHTGQKVKRTLQFYSYYIRVFGEETTKQMFFGIRSVLIRKGKGLLLSAVCFTPFNWKDNKITDEKLKESINELKSVNELTAATVYCNECHRRLMVDRKVNEILYCSCGDKVNYVDKYVTYDSWEPFLEREHILVWRKKHPMFPQLYCYKVYGTYEDVSASAFMEVQLNTSLRTQWDTSALDLRILHSQECTNSALLYWLVKYPHFFANREYLFQRRFSVNDCKKEIVIVNEVVDPCHTPPVNGVHRVSDYWSIMVIRATENFNKPGMEYTLTYFDNPGTSLPTPVTNFVASTGFPDFLCKVYSAALSLQKRWQSGEDVYVSLPAEMRYGRTLMQLPQNVSEQHIHAIVQEKASPASTIAVDPGKCVEDKSKSPDDIMEALQLVVPNVTEAVQSITGDSATKNSLRDKLVALRERAKLFLEEANKKKQNSLQKMNEVESRRGYDYDEVRDERNVLVENLFMTIQKLLEADKDMRTGKGLIQREDVAVKHMHMLVKNEGRGVTRNDEIQEKTIDCMCCACEEIAKANVALGVQHLKEGLSNEYCRCCSCQHKVKQNTDFRSKLKAKTNHEFQSNSPNHVCSNDATPNISHLPTTCANNMQQQVTYHSHTSQQQPTKNAIEASSSIDVDNKATSWYWYPIYGGTRLIVWLSSLWYDKST